MTDPDRLRKLRAQIHIAGQDLGLSEDLRRDAMAQYCGKRSTSEMTAADMEAVISGFRARGWKPRKGGRRLSPRSRGRTPKRPIDKLRSTWIALHRAGLVDDGSEAALDSWARARFPVDAAAWLSDEDMPRAIEMLKQWLKRARRDEQASA